MSACSCGGATALGLRQDNLVVPKGRDYGYVWSVIYPDTLAPLDLTGWTARAQARPRPGDTGTPRQTWTTENGGFLIAQGDDKNELVMLFPDDMTSAWDWSRSAYDVELFAPDSSGPFFFTGGTINAVDGVTLS